MKTISSFRLKGIIGIVVVLLSACSKYSEGPKFSLRTVSKRLSGNWEISSYTIDGNDSLSILPYKNISISSIHKKKFRAYSIYEWETYKLATINSHPDGVGIAIFQLNEDKSELLFYDTIAGDCFPCNPIHFPSYNPIASQYFFYNTENWLQEPIPSKGNRFEIIQLKNNKIKLKSHWSAISQIEYELIKI